MTSLSLLAAATLCAAPAAGDGATGALHLQMSAHLSPVHTDLDVLSKWTFYVVAGVSVRLGPAGLLRIGVAENVITPYRGADFALLADGGLQL